MTYSDLIEDLPAELQLPMMKLLDRLREDLLDSVRRADFERLQAAIEGLAGNMEQFSAAQVELIKAQRKTEERLDRLTERVDGLAERMEELAEAQRKTEERLDRLTERVDGLAVRMEELAEAQRKTEETVRGLVRGQAELRRQVGGLSNSFGYLLEDVAIRCLPAILERELGLKIEVMDRRFLVYPDGGEDEINIYGEGRINGKKVYIIGESKSQLGRRDVDRFKKLVARANDFLKGTIIPIIVTHSSHPKVEAYAQDKIKEIRVYKSYQLK